MSASSIVGRVADLPGRVNEAPRPTGQQAGQVSDLPHVFVIGYPGDVGGANTECWHTLRLWRAHGLSVSCLPTWQPDGRWQSRLASIGCRTIVAGPEELPHVSGLAGSVVVSFCNSRFLQAAERFRDLGCKLVWVGCMTWLLPEERKFCRRRGPMDAYVFQSRYQEEQLGGQLAKFGVGPERCFRIRGPLDFREFPFRPLAHRRGTPLVVGRISRAAEDKFSAATWPIYRRIPHPVRARVMAWDEAVAHKLGPPPVWAECLPAHAESPQDFFAKLHCMLQVNGQAEENWPRSGLEAMASGVPVVAQNEWGWKEMIRHGETGLLADSPDELAYWAARLAYDEDYRLQIAHRARRVLEDELANPTAIWSAWQRLFEAMRG